MSRRCKSEQKIKISRRVLVYSEGKLPGRDEPDQVIEGSDRFVDLPENAIRNRFKKGGIGYGINKRCV